MGIYSYCCSQANILANSISGASSEGIYCLDSGVTVENNLVTGGSIGMYLRGSNGPVANNTLTANATGLRTTVSSNTISNNVIAFNSSCGLYSGDFSGQAEVLSCNDVYGNTLTGYSGVNPGASDISADPLFVDSTGNYHLQAGSPCIDAGDDTAVQTGETDLDGNPRIMGAQVDIGTYECGLSATVSAAAGQADPAVTSPINFAVTFSEPVTGFTSAGVTLSGSANPTTAAVTDSGDDMNFNVAVSGMTSDGTVSVTVVAGAATDAYGFGNSSSNESTVNFSITGNIATTVLQALSYASSDSVTLSNVVASSALDEFTNCFYVQDQDFANGMKMVYSATTTFVGWTGSAALSRGDIVSVTGTKVR